MAGLVGCKATPEKVCSHLEELGAPASGEGCVRTMSLTQQELGTYWDDVGACFLASREVGELSTCYEVIDTIMLQDLCRRMVERSPSVYEGSLPNCLRDLRVLKRDDAAGWAKRQQCLDAAKTTEDLERCRR